MGNIKLKELLNKIDANQLVLPDFQREYVWLEEGKIEGFIASVLAQLPLGSIITFNQDSNVFANKIIGFKKYLESSDVRKVDYLLDGQQRITTLSLVFSERIFNSILEKKNKVDELLRPKKMLVRYFLSLPINEESSVSDHFGYLNLKFPFDPDNITFCSNDIIELIKCETFKFSEDNPKWFTPIIFSKMGGLEKSKYLDKAANAGMIPLYFLADNESALRQIIDKISNKRYEDLRTLFMNSTIEEIKILINKLGLDSYINYSSVDLLGDINELLKDRARNWANDFSVYLHECMDMWINTVEVKDDRPDRAINIYEALNKGGAKLSTFDLIIAKAASKRNNKKYFSMIKDDILSNYNNSDLLYILSDGKVTNWNAKDYMSVITSNDIVSSNVINQFLNLLCITANMSDKQGNIIDNKLNDELSPSYCKEKMQLDLTADQIWDYSEKTMKAICDALMIMQMKFGIINVKSIKYGLILLPIAYACYLMNNKKIDTALEKDRFIRKTIKRITSWYWYSLFSGEYASDQSTIVIKHIKWINNWINNDIIPDKLNQQNINTSLSYILNKDKYNDFKMLIFEEDVIPKEAVTSSLIQFILSLNPSDFIVDSNGNTKKLCAWDKSVVYEIHHMIPLGSVTNIGESTKSLRNKKNAELPINSPLNLAYISKEANDKIKELYGFYPEF